MGVNERSPFTPNRSTDPYPLPKPLTGRTDMTSCRSLDPYELNPEPILYGIST